MSMTPLTYYKKCFFLIFFTCITLILLSQPPANSFSYREKNFDSTNTSIDSILIIGYGTSTSAIFFDNISSKLIKKLKDEYIRSESRFLGKTGAEAKDSFNRIPLDNYKAYIFITPDYEAFFQVDLHTVGAGIPTQRGKANFYFYTETYNYEGHVVFKLYTRDEQARLLWTASISTDMNLVKQAVYSKIAKRIVTGLKKHKYIR